MGGPSLPSAAGADPLPDCRATPTRPSAEMGAAPVGAIVQRAGAVSDLAVERPDHASAATPVVAAWQERRNAAGRTTDWRFSTADAGIEVEEL